MSIREEFTTALKESLKAKDQVAMSTIRLITAAMKDRDIAARGSGNADGISEAEILSMMQSMIKQRQESSKTYRDNDEDETDKAISDIIAEMDASSIKDMGKVMGELKSRYAGQLDMAKAGGQVKAKLAG